MEPLRAVATEIVHDSLLGITLDALGDELQAENFAEADDAFAHGEVEAERLVSLVRPSVCCEHAVAVIWMECAHEEIGIVPPFLDR